MYENGKRLNRHARKRRHIDNLKRRTTPPGYASYEQFCRRKDAEYKAIQNSIYNWVRHNDKEWYEKYWHAYSGFLGTAWKKDLKGAAHREERQYWREYLTDVIKELDIMDEESMEEIDCPHFRKGHRGSDPWAWD